VPNTKERLIKVHAGLEFLIRG